MADFLNRECIGTRMQFDRGNRRLYVDGCPATKRSDLTKLPSDEQVAFVKHFESWVVKREYPVDALDIEKLTAEIRPSQ